jgi:hypothetical protein
MYRPSWFSAPRKRVRIGVAVVLAAAAAIPSATVNAADPAARMVLDWNQYAIEAIANPVSPPVGVLPGAGQSPTVGILHVAMTQLAVYDAVNAIARTHEPYLRGLPRASRTANKAAAAATAAHHVLVGLVPALPDVVKTRLDGLYASSLDTIPDGRRKNAGIRIGAAVAAKMLAKRANDGRYVPYQFATGTGPGEWRPVLPAFGNDPFAWVANVKPFAIRRASQFRTKGPLALTSARYAAEYDEVKRLGSNAVPSERTPEQTELARFFTVNPMPLFHKSFRDIATAKHLSSARAARLFALLSMSAADAIIGCWDDKDHWNFWRPITAIQEGDNDGNPATSGQASWLPFFPTPPYPDHPSGYNCFTGATIYAAKAFFGTDRVRITLTSSAGSAPRTYARLSRVVKDTIDARIYLGFHFRTPDVQGASLGRNTANWIASRYLERDD